MKESYLSSILQSNIFKELLSSKRYLWGVWESCQWFGGKAVFFAVYSGSSTSYNWLVTTYTQNGKKTDEKQNSNLNPKDIYQKSPAFWGMLWE